VAIVNPETREICLSREIGEIWVSSEANVQSYQGAAREHGGRTLSNASPLSVEASTAPIGSTGDSEKSTTTDPASPSDLNSRYNVTISGGDARINYVRTGEIGFLWNYSKETFNNGKPTSLLFVLGSIGETFEVNGLMHFPKDIEATVERAHPNVAPNGR
jgi:acyl-CoA synthetase (AMP-forming)/AMP-acid ligase II